MSVIKCAFCKGKGKDPFNLLSALSICQVCGGTGKVEVIEPAIKCVYCNGTGVYPYNGRVTCTVCNGKGSVTVKGATSKCPVCKGTGRAVDSGLPCLSCSGTGVVVKKVLAKK